ncbi:hypothetical protein V6B14_22010 (plasmid) [Sporosarcina psychrophila]|uniref:hypothetical protein n=1 Tax=Sporosarcina psychrophila TaxID=1476 RepID=UPI0030CB44A3
MYGSKTWTYSKGMVIHMYGKFTISKSPLYENRVADKGANRLTGSEETPKDICTARKQGTREARDVVKG